MYHCGYYWWEGAQASKQLQKNVDFFFSRSGCLEQGLSVSGF